MKQSISAVAATLTAVCIGALFSFAARAQTARELLHVCEPLQRGMHVEGAQVFLPPGSDVAQCWGFINAVQQYGILADQDGRTWLGASRARYDYDASASNIHRIRPGPSRQAWFASGSRCLQRHARCFSL